MKNEIALSVGNKKYSVWKTARIERNLITSTVFSLNDTEGTTTTLTLKRPDAFDPQPVLTNDDASAIWPEIAKGV